MAVTLNALTTGVGGLQTTGDTSGQISLQSNGSTVLTMTASGVSVTGTLTASTALGIGSGGTGATTATAAFDALNPMTTTGDIIYESSPTVAARLPIGTTGQVLTVAGGLPSWAAAAGGQLQTQTFTSPGTWTKPSSASQVRVTVIGGGGGGGSHPSGPTPATAGGIAGHGGYAKAIVPVSNPVAITVGAGGGSAASGGTSSFGAAVSATAGSGGNPSASGGVPGSPGSGTVTTGTALRTNNISIAFGVSTADSFIYGGQNAAGANTGGVAFSVTSPLGSGVGGAGGVSGPAFNGGGGVGGSVIVEFVG